MPYEVHPSFPFPTNPKAKIWRYMDFTKFVDSLERNCLHFARIDKLGDPYEFAVPSTTRRRHPHGRALPKITKRIENTTYVNCWHCNEDESAAMWRLYLKSDEGIAIQSTAKRFAESFRSYSQAVFIGSVTYIDYEIDDLVNNNECVFDYCVLKRRSYSHENELRAVITHGELMSPNPGPSGIQIPVILDELIETGLCSPHTSHMAL